MKTSKAMQRSILRILRPFTKDLAQCDGRRLSGVSINISYANESPKEFHRDFYDYAEIIVQDVRFNGFGSRHERDVYYVRHDGKYSFYQS